MKIRKDWHRKKRYERAKNFDQYVEGSHVKRHNAVVKPATLNQGDLAKVYDWEHARNLGYDHRSSAWLREEAVKSITDSDLLERIALKDINAEVRRRALMQSKNNVNLLNKAKLDHSRLVRDYARRRLDRISNAVRFIKED